MKELTRKEKKELIHRLYWDMDVDADRILRFLEGETDDLGRITADSLYHRMLKTFSWYTLRKMVSTDRLSAALDERILSRLYPVDLKERYTYAREVLSR